MFQHFLYFIIYLSQLHNSLLYKNSSSSNNNIFNSTHECWISFLFTLHTFLEIYVIRKYVFFFCILELPQTPLVIPLLIFVTVQKFSLTYSLSLRDFASPLKSLRRVRKETEKFSCSMTVVDHTPHVIPERNIGDEITSPYGIHSTGKIWGILLAPLSENNKRLTGTAQCIE